MLTPINEILTIEQLTGHSWAWGPANHPVQSTTFGFTPDGLITGWENHPQEISWKLDDNGLKIFSAEGKCSWIFNIADKLGDEIRLFGSCQQPGFQYLVYQLIAPLAPPKAKEEGIRLVIWDLDDTFWNGTLSEGEITQIPENINIVKELNRRGIVNAICSRNDFSNVESKLKELGVWDEFIFPRIEWGPKGPLIKDIVEQIQLRPASILFIDDNVTNLNEALHFVPSINVAEPTIIPTLLADPKFKGKPDPTCKRLKQYRVLEAKQKDKSAMGGDNISFLRDSNIRISFHTDIEQQFPRIHDLVNRTNQLNFTKKRWPEDIEEARKIFEAELQEEFNSNVGYVKVSDAYGNYGICGFYFIQRDTCKHFLFSCRTMNMGVEQAVWQKLGRKHIEIQGKVASRLDMPLVDWVSFVPDIDHADDGIAGTAPRPTICLRGACDMMMTAHFLRTDVETKEEFNYPYEGWEIATTLRSALVNEALERPINRQIIAALPGIPENRFATATWDETADVYVFTFGQETFHGLYRSKTTGMTIPMGTYALPYYLPGGPFEKFDYTSVPYEEIQDKLPNTTRDQWNFFRSEFSFIGGFNKDIFVKDLRTLFTRLKRAGKTIIIVGLNSKVGRDLGILSAFGQINELTLPVAREFGVDFIDAHQFVKSENDLAKDGSFGGSHYERRVYKQISDAILNIVHNKIKNMKTILPY
ncbi:HAD-IIIC family phosphatase [Acetobacter pasteurianus]|uniref:Phosphatase IIIC n=1 Tax=Acetobacter pasteurianus NBRC 3188 TaxID=1226663 RepID=A0A401WUS0_ACEPA|nr:HAD-IIIC family phosphatase [Acetobacter pasteurianus]GCD53098.1 phosphatase IIIC [Acetobacter pasteurianus NBRC 3188]